MRWNDRPAVGPRSAEDSLSGELQASVSSWKGPGRRHDHSVDLALAANSRRLYLDGHVWFTTDERGCADRKKVYFLREAVQKANTSTTSVEAHVLAFRTTESPISDVGPSLRAVKKARRSRSPAEARTSVRFSSCASGSGSGTATWNVSSDADRGHGGACAFKGGRTSACDTPPKKSVTSVSWSGRLKRSERTPGCERIFTGSYVLNCADMVRQEHLGVGGKRVAYEILHGGLACLVDALHELQDVVRVGIDNGYSNVVVIFVLS